MTSPVYRYLVGELSPASGNGLRDELPFTSVEFSHVLNRPGAFSARIPLRLPRTTRTAYLNQHLALDGTSGTRASTPDSAALSITSDIDVRVRVAPTDWTPAAEETFVAKWVSGQRSWLFSLFTTGRLRLRLSSDGTSIVSADSSVGSGFVDASTHWVRVTWRNSDDRVQFFTSEDGVTWSQLGTDKSLAVSAIFDSTSAVEIGSTDNGTLLRYTGKVFAVEVRNGIDGAVVANPSFDFYQGPWINGDVSPTARTDGIGNIWILNGAASIAGTISTTTAPSKVTRANLDPGRSAIHVERDGVIVWSGILWTARADVASAVVEVGGEGWWSYFRRRLVRVTRTYSAADQLFIARDLINYAQAQPGGNVGVLVGTETSGVGRDRTYYSYERKGIAEAVEQLAAVTNGFDFAIDVAYESGVITKRFRPAYPRRGRTTAIVFELGTNLESLSQEIDATRQANQIDAIGAGEGDAMLIATATDTSQLASYPLTEDVIALKDVSVTSTLVGHAALEVAARVAPVMRLPTLVAHQASPDVSLGAFITGDTITVKGSDGYVSVNEQMRIMEYATSVDVNGREALTLALAQLEAAL